MRPRLTRVEKLERRLELFSAREAPAQDAGESKKDHLKRVDHHELVVGVQVEGLQAQIAVLRQRPVSSRHSYLDARDG